MNGIFIGFLIFHVLCCIITLIGVYTKILDVHKAMFFVVMFLPFWGFLIVILVHFQVVLKYDATKNIEVEKMQIDSELYKNIDVENKGSADTYVPLEEALIINSPFERRMLIMDVLNDNPSEYTEFLKKAGNNDDTEVVHYAVTAMVEISKENDFMLQHYEKEYSANPDDYGVLSDYCEFLWSCLEQKLMEGQVEVLNRNTFDMLITKKLLYNENVPDLLRKAENSIKLGNYTDAETAIDKAYAIDPQDEQVFMHRLRFYALVERSDKMKVLLEDKETRKTYLSAKAREEVAFWTE